MTETKILDNAGDSLQFDNQNANNYDSNVIISLNPIEHIRSRPGMYIGSLGNGERYDDGIYVLLKEVIDNCIDEFLMGAGRRVVVEIAEDETVKVRDYGRGIPLDKVRECVSQINTGGKFGVTGADGTERAFSSSIGMNGVGLKAVNFLSELFVARCWRNGKMATVKFSEGILESEEISDCEDNLPSGTEITFRPSHHIFDNYHFDKDYVRRRMQHYAWLNNGLSLLFNGEKFYSRRGLIDLLEAKIKTGANLYEISHYKSDNLEFAFCHTADSIAENYFSFVNTQFTSEGGAHLSAFKEGFAAAIKELATNKTLDSDDIRGGIIAAVAVRLQDPLFSSQTKNKLDDPKVRPAIIAEVKQATLNILYKKPDIKDSIFAKIEKNESIRKQIQAVKKGAKELEKRNSIRIDKLWDCRFHFTDAESKRKAEDRQKCYDSMLFITEGLSAAGSVVKARNSETQAVFCLTGKPLNSYGMTKEEIYQNAVFYGMMKTIGVEDGNIENLRFGKIIIATDADVDGFHIRNLLITYFLTFFQFLIDSDHVFILETPLFRVRDKVKTIYCYNEKERDEAIQKIGKNAETTRFKGLGEISPEEFGQFIGDDIKLKPIKIDSPHRIDDILKYYMGSNTPTRRDFILNNLV